MKYSKALPTINIRVHPEAAEKIKKVSYDQRISLADALDLMLKQNDAAKIEELEKKINELNREIESDKEYIDDLRDHVELGAIYRRFLFSMRDALSEIAERPKKENIESLIAEINRELLRKW